MSRLMGIIVKEVSLVDKAANKRKFLFAKRDDGQTDKNEIVKACAESLDELMKLAKFVGEGEGSHAELPEYAKQARAILSGKLTEAVTEFTPEVLRKLAEVIDKIEKAKKKTKEDEASEDEDEDKEMDEDAEDNFTPEEEEKLKKIAEALPALEAGIKELATQ